MSRDSCGNLLRVISFLFRLIPILYVKFEDNDVTIFYDIFFAFQSYLSSFFCLSPRSRTNDVLIGDNFCFDKSFFKIGMDGSCCLWSRRIDTNCPCFGFFFSRSEVVHQSDLIKCQRDKVI
jgi:hypothetical protein